jgi:hypothetical protein
MITNLSSSQLRKAAKLKDKIEGLQKLLNKFLGAGAQAQPKAAKKKRKMSAAGKRAIIAAQKLRWAKVKAGKKK